MDDSALQNDSPIESVDVDVNTDVFGSLNDELSEVASKTVERALESFLQRLPPFGNTKALFRRLQWNYLAKVDLLEIYNRRNVFSLDNVQPVSLRSAAARLYLQSQDVQQLQKEAAPKSLPSNSNLIEDDTTEFRLGPPLPSKHDLQTLEAEVDQLQARATHLRHIRNVLHTELSQVSVSPKSGDNAMASLFSVRTYASQHLQSNDVQQLRKEAAPKSPPSNSTSIEDDTTEFRLGPPLPSKHDLQTLEAEVDQLQARAAHLQHIRNGLHTELSQVWVSAKSGDSAMASLSSVRTNAESVWKLSSELEVAIKQAESSCEQMSKRRCEDDLTVTSPRPPKRKTLAGQRCEGNQALVKSDEPNRKKRSLSRGFESRRARIGRPRNKRAPRNDISCTADRTLATEHDVVFGGNAGVLHRPAIVLFRSLIKERAKEYGRCYNHGKKHQIVLETMREFLDTGGRFLKQDGEIIVNGIPQPFFEVAVESAVLRYTKHRFYICQREKSSAAQVDENSVSDNDVIYGRSRGWSQRPANLLFRSEIEERATRYWLCPGLLGREEIAKEVVRVILDSGGRFLKQLEEQDCDVKSKAVKCEIVDEASAIQLTKKRFYKVRRSMPSAARALEKSMQVSRTAPIPEGIVSADGTSPSYRDVILGKERLPAEQRSANSLFRSHITERALEYERCCTNTRKDQIVEEAVRQVLDSGGRFLKQVDENIVSGNLNPVYEVVDEVAAFSSTKRHFRDAVVSMDIVPDEIV